MGSISCTRILFAVSLVALIPYIALRVFGLLGCVFGKFFAEFIDFLQLIVTVAADSYYVYKGVKVAMQQDDILIKKCYKYFSISVILAIFSLIMTTCFDDEEMMATSYEVINIIALLFSGATLFLFNMKILDDKEETNNNV